jgi:hypothetical protein
MIIRVELVGNNEEEIGKIVEMLATFNQGVKVTPSAVVKKAPVKAPVVVVEEAPVVVEEAPVVVVEEAPVEAEDVPAVDMASCKALATELIGKNKQNEVKAVINGAGYAALSKVPQDKLGEIYAQLLALKG